MSRPDGMHREPNGELVPEPSDRHDCRDGWDGEDWSGRPIPCPICRPHVQRRQLPGGPTITTARPDPHGRNRP
ncbi:hypothetical protein [Jiangella sp. DSM 45060]|uniref:hypothetical protein n=1 Tax=Jiangella sp. DSM 45060 TaxID=1798224 RepID=UPI00087B9213|nr:hypothetical protein [Jiangella sp. DSM 45060]SDT69553.1 hypothetical protein SAMN04515669_6038 [Jiangella sp. DSM 45060]